jgi:Tfp pilus assembly protein PilF
MPSVARPLRAAIVAAFIACIPFATALAAEHTKGPEIAEASRLLDSWTGNPETLARAELELQKAAKTQPGNPWIPRERARLYIMAAYSGPNPDLEALNRAEREIKTALGFDAEFAPAFVLWGHLAQEMGQPERALLMLQKAQALGSTDPWLHANWAEVLRSQEKYAEAAEHYQKAIDTAAGARKVTSASLEGLIKIYRATGQLDKADETYRREIAFDPGAPWPRGNYANFLLYARDDYDGAIANARDALQRMDYGAGRCVLATALYRKWVVEGPPKAKANDALRAEADRLMGKTMEPKLAMAGACRA